MDNDTRDVWVCVFLGYGEVEWLGPYALPSEAKQAMWLDIERHPEGATPGRAARSYMIIRKLFDSRDA